jgi:DnaJ-class molecular chaperone
MITEIDCTECDGTGSREHDISTYTDTSPQSEYRECEECNGSGEVEIEIEE